MLEGSGSGVGGQGLKPKVSVKSRGCPEECVAAVVGVAVKRTRSGEVRGYIQRVYIHPSQ